MSRGIRDPMTRLGITNKDWGVCGFTSTMYAMYDLHPATRPYVINASSAWRILAEIKTYLNILKAENSNLLDGIRDFTRSFGAPHDTFTIDDYIKRVSDGAAMNKTRQQILSDERYGIGMPPQAVADYVQRIWEWKATVTEFAVGSGGGDGIIGVTEDNMPLYHGLCHYMYRSGATIYSWGQSFNSVEAAAKGGAGGAKWRVCYVISLQRP